MESARAVKLWYDPEGDYMEVLFERKAGSTSVTRRMNG